MIIKIDAPVWIHDGASPWYFATINKDATLKIRELNLPKRGWGSIKVIATVGKTKWETSIFPDKDEVYLLPIKKSVRKEENIWTGSKIKLVLDIIESDLVEQT